VEQERQDKLRELEIRVFAIENSYQPLLAKLDVVADKLTANTIQQTKTEAGHKEVQNMIIRLQKRQDKQEAEAIGMVTELATYKPTIAQMAGLGNKAIYFGVAMTVTSVSILIAVAKMLMIVPT